MNLNSGFADTTSSGTTTTNTSRRSTSTVRSRRLVSFTDDDEDNNGQQPLSTGISAMLSPGPSNVRSRGATPSPRPSRAVSPIPMSHPSRFTQSSDSATGKQLGRFGDKGRNRMASTKLSHTGIDLLDVSWSSLQSLASSVLGSDTARPTSNGAPRTHVRKPSRPDFYTRMVPSRTSSAPTWGPSGPQTLEIGVGTKEERRAFVQAKKREALLLAETDPSWSLKSSHKRRDSSDQNSRSNVNPTQEEQALVYVHQVQPTDSITGVTIRYGCQPAVFRKANGFWPSDSIQGRKTVLLPVDSCSIKGRPTQPSGEADLLGGDRRRSSIEDLSGSSIAPTPAPNSPILSSIPTSTDTDEGTKGDQIWKHESWVTIDGFPEPVEIGRVPRSALGFFPRTRRKSLSYTDPEPSMPDQELPPTLFMTSSHPTQSYSSQLPHVPRTRPHADSAASRTSANSKPGARHKRQRSGLELSGTGVGTLDRDAVVPGPALDGLSKFFSDHFAPTRQLPNLDSPNEFRTASPSNISMPLENIGGAVEGWVKKMTIRAKTSFNELQQGAYRSQSNGRHQATNRRGLDDLIELDDGLESRHSSGLLAGPSWNPNFNRSSTSLHGGAKLRGRFPSSSPSTSRTRMGPDRVKDD